MNLRAFIRPAASFLVLLFGVLMVFVGVGTQRFAVPLLWDGDVASFLIFGGFVGSIGETVALLLQRRREPVAAAESGNPPGPSEEDLR